MNFFLEKLSEQYTDDYILLICDGAAWHKPTELIIPENIELFFIPPYTPEMNPHRTNLERNSKAWLPERSV